MTPTEIIKQAANGNADAERFLLRWAQFCHLLDDLMDRDKDRKPREVSAVMIEFICELSANPFYQQHKSWLLGLVVMAANAWADSEDLAGSEKDVLKGAWHEVIYGTAFLTSGSERMHELTAAAREYDHERKP